MGWRRVSENKHLSPNETNQDIMVEGELMVDELRSLSCELGYDLVIRSFDWTKRNDGG